MSAPITSLHAGNSAVYRPKPLVKHVRLCWEPATYALSWGKQQFDGPHMRVEGSEPYGVDLQAFYATHEACKDRPDHYIKVTPVRAMQVTEETPLATFVRERLEAESTVQPGGWIVQNPDGELYYNTAADFEQRYERDPSDRPKAPRGSAPPTLEEHLFGDGPKRILALDGGGIRGRITLGILQRIEAVVGSPLSSHFDLIGGTSTGSIIATGLALGWPVQKLIELYDQLGESVFQSSFHRQGLWRTKFPTKPLEQALEGHFGDERLGSPKLKTGLAIMTKRLDTNSPWPLHNNPRGHYFDDPPAGENWVPNKNFLLRQLVRASTAAPSYFEPERIEVTHDAAGAFVDGGASPHNNPALQLLLLATLKGYGFHWPLGVDRLQIVSVGTGLWRARHATEELLGKPALGNAMLSLLSLMDDCSALNQLLLQWLSDSPIAEPIDAEVGSLAGEYVCGDQPLLSYLRYNARLELPWLTARLPEAKLDARALEQLRKMDNPASLALLAKVGEAAAKDVVAEHLLPV